MKRISLSSYVPEFGDVHINLLHEAERRLYVPFRYEYVGHLVLELLVHVRLGELEHEVPLLCRRLKSHPFGCFLVQYRPL